MKLANVAIFMIAAMFLINLTDGGRKSSVNLEPSFAPLEEGEGSFSATIYDENVVSQIKDVSFFGHTNIGGIRKETDDSLNKLEISKIKEIRIIKHNYDSKRYSDKEFTLAQVITNDNTVIDNLLIPKHVVICGSEIKTQMERSWFLSKIDKIVIGKPSGLIDKIMSGVATVTQIEEKPVAGKAVEKTGTVESKGLGTKSDEPKVIKYGEVSKVESSAAPAEKKTITHDQERKQPETIGDALRGFLFSIVDLLRTLVQGIFSLFR